MFKLVNPLVFPYSLLQRDSAERWLSKSCVSELWTESTSTTSHYFTIRLINANWIVIIQYVFIVLKYIMVNGNDKFTLGYGWKYFTSITRGNLFIT